MVDGWGQWLQGNSLTFLFLAVLPSIAAIPTAGEVGGACCVKGGDHDHK